MSESDLDIFEVVDDPLPHSNVEYFWFVGFEWNVHEEKPFQIFVREYFGDEDIPDSWFSGVLTDKNRAVKLSLNAVAGNNLYSIFAKIEKGRYNLNHTGRLIEL